MAVAEKTAIVNRIKNGVCFHENLVLLGKIKGKIKYLSVKTILSSNWFGLNVLIFLSLTYDHDLRLDEPRHETCWSAL